MPHLERDDAPDDGHEAQSAGQAADWHDLVVREIEEDPDCWTDDPNE